MTWDLKKWVLVRFFPKYFNRYYFFAMKKRKIDFINPITFSEKIRYIMLNSKDNKKMAYCADKSLVRRYVEKKGLKHILI